MKIVINQPLSFSRLGQRENQEDARFPDMDAPSVNSRVFAVCDGVGGSSHGEVASQIVASTFGEQLNNFDLSEGLTTEQFNDVLDNAYDALDQKAEEDEFSEMSTTFTLAVLHGAGITLAHMGDSRIYQYRPSQGIIYRSEDHSLVNSWVRDGIISPEEAINHPRRNVITRSMTPVPAGENRDMASLLCTDDVEAGDYIFLCTDGVLHGLSDEDLFAILEDKTLTDEQRLSHIADACKDSDDNNTAMLIPIKEVLGKVIQHEVDDDTDTTGTLNLDKQESVIDVKSVRRNDMNTPWYKRILKRFFLLSFLSCLMTINLSAQDLSSSMVFDDYWVAFDSIAQKQSYIEQLQTAVLNGDQSASMTLWKSYMNGDSVARDYDHALQWMAVAFAHGNRDEIRRMMRGQIPGVNDTFKLYVQGMRAYMIDKDFKLAEKLFKKVEKKGIADATAVLGLIFANKNNPKKDLTKAVKLLQKAIDKGSNSAYYYLGRLYESGTGVEANQEKALDLIEAAALNGNAAAQCHLGETYFSGKNVEINLVFAFEYFKQAQQQMQLTSQAARHMKRCYELQAGDVHQANEIEIKIKEINRCVSNNQLSSMLNEIEAYSK